MKDQCDLVWLENLNLRGGFKKDILAYIQEKYPDLMPLYNAIYTRGDRGYFRELEERAERLAREYDCPFVDNELPLRPGRAGASGHRGLLLSRGSARLGEHRPQESVNPLGAK